MDVVVKRARAVAGRIAAPPSKSMAHRAVLCAALAKGTSHLHHLAFSKDISATLGAAGRLCARVTTGENDAVVEGLGRFLPVDPAGSAGAGETAAAAHSKGKVIDISRNFRRLCAALYLEN